jgi:hypothetical protein
MLRAALRALRRDHAALAADVADGRRFFWLGSGISRNQVPDLVAVIERVLLFLRDRAANGPDELAHKNALIEILKQHLPAELPRYEADPEAWAPLSTEPLRNVYSEVLGTRVGENGADYLLMTAADLPNIYGADNLVPGTAHYLIAILIAEGAVKEIASGNWDGLVEAAVADLTRQPGVLDVYVAAEDARDTNAFAQIAKFHGCAVLAKRDPARYAGKIIATRAQIARFESSEFAHMRSALKERTTRYRSLVLGLSMQDSDLLTVFTRAAELHPWPWDPDHPAYVFAEPDLKGSQRDVLENGYGSDFDGRHKEILERSTFGTYAEPLLAALVLEVLARKYHALLARQSTVPQAIEDDLRRGLQRMVDLVGAAIGDAPPALLAFLLGPYAAIVRGFHCRDDECKYVTLFRGTRPQIAIEPSVTVMGSDLLVAAIGLLGWGDQRRRWRVRTSPRNTPNAIRLLNRSSDAVVLVIVKGTREADAILSSSEWISGADRMTILYAHDRPNTAVRSSASMLGGGRRRSERYEISWSDLTELATDTEEIADRFQAEAGL